MAFCHKSIKGDFLLKIQLSDLTKSIFGEPKGSLAICSIPLLRSRFSASGPFRRGVNSNRINSNNNSILSKSICSPFQYSAHHYFLITMVKSAILGSNSVSWVPINNSINTGWILDFFFNTSEFHQESIAKIFSSI